MPPSLTHIRHPLQHFSVVAAQAGAKGGFLEFFQRDLERIHAHTHHTHTHTIKSHKDWLVHLFGASEVSPGDLVPSALLLCLGSHE